MKTNDLGFHAEGNLEKAYKQLKDTYIELIFRLALMAESRDKVTGTHLVRVADYCRLIGEGLGLPEKELEVLRYASPMHDIGKIMLPDSILKKKGKLTPEQIVVMRKHPLTGYDVFKNADSPILQACGEIALTHHEQFDGNGYPHGLKGTEIPIFGRIVGLADFFDACTSWRPYKRAYTFEEGIAMIMERAGTHFDPKVLMAFMRSKEKAKRIYDANKKLEKFLAETEHLRGKKK